MRKVKFLFLILLILQIDVLLSQEITMSFGLEESDTNYISFGQIDTSDLNRDGEAHLPSVVNYRNKISVQVFDQGFVPACVGYAIASAVTIRMNLYCNVNCSCKKTQPPFSAAYLYNQISGGKLCGISLARALDTLEKQGICPERNFQNDRYSASKQPDRSVRNTASKFNFWKAERIFFLPYELQNNDERYVLVLKILKAYIFKSKPIIVGLRCPEDFKTFKGKVYKPGTLPAKANHAALVVGYDDKTKTIEILNSFGEDWGDDGFARIGYEDFCEMVRYGYVTRLNGDIGDSCRMK
ncbi:MAG: C1 family peptidase [Saprospiraceae bacterium]|nr:C1 family peptidase [Saprospiraceae bacterium]